MTGGIQGQVQVLNLGVGMVLAPFGDYFSAELAGNGVGAQDAGIDVQKFHDQCILSWKVPTLKLVGLGMILFMNRLIDKSSKMRYTVSKIGQCIHARPQ